LEQNVNEQTTGISEKNLPLQESLEELNYLYKTKSRFLADISHDFRTPLTLIQGTLEQILAQQTGEKFENQIKMMLRNCSALLGMADQMLEQARFESGNMKLGESSLSSMDTKFIKDIQAIIEKNIANPGFKKGSHWDALCVG
jgi:signal transduction histidine kinase